MDREHNNLVSSDSPRANETGAVWRPRPFLGSWTPDQEAIAGLFPGSRRVAVAAANGVGKTYLAADLVVSFIQDHEDAKILLVAPTNRQVDRVLWPMVAQRLIVTGLKPEHWRRPRKPMAEWPEPDADSLLGFATNCPERMQGFHAEHLLIVLDEASGLEGDLIAALEGIAVGVRNYVFAIGNPNDAIGGFFDMFRSTSWAHRELSALSHPNVVSRTDVIPGATTWTAVLAHLRDWCTLEAAGSDSPDTFTLAVSDFDLGLGPETACVTRTFTPNDEFRIRFLGWFPKASEFGLFRANDVDAAQDRAADTSGRRTAAVDVARFGGDSTWYGIRTGDTVTRFRSIPPGTLGDQAGVINSMLMDDRPVSVTVDAAGMGIGLVDALMPICCVPVRQFNGANTPVSTDQQRRYANRRTAAYARLADAFVENRICIPRDPQLVAELLAVRYRYDGPQIMHLVDKDKTRELLGRSPDRADTLSMLWDEEFINIPSSSGRQRAQQELEQW